MRCADCGRVLRRVLTDCEIGREHWTPISESNPAQLGPARCESCLNRIGIEIEQIARRGIALGLLFLYSEGSL